MNETQLKKIRTIAQKFIDEKGMYRSEEDVQSSYTLPLLRVLGWESDNWKINTGQEVKTGKKPDILLKGLSGGSIFVIESKEPRKSLDDRYPKTTFVEQLCNYCNAEGVYWGVLTNFHEWRIYSSYKKELYYNKRYKLIVDVETNPIVNPNDEDLVKLFSELGFSQLRAKKGRIDKNPTYYKKEAEIRAEFFTQLKEWRTELRSFIYSKYKSVCSVQQIDNQTQKILDRLIFIQVCFKKEIISQDVLGSVLFSEKKDFYDELKEKFKVLNQKFNTELFATDLCDTFQIEDETTETIISGINTVDFSNVSPHIMGEVYEDYLGELLKESKKNLKADTAKEKKKKKSQGIYYTPESIVDFVIENTLGGLLKQCKTERDIERIKVLDPACGSGSFLIKAYKAFLDAYTSMRQKKKSKLGNIFDDFEIRKKILLHNLFGVDLDERAVEIAKLNLFISALDGLKESDVTGIKILPNLTLNIRCGNSLISGVSENTDENLDSQLTFEFDDAPYKSSIKKLIGLKNEFYEEHDNIERDKLIKLIVQYETAINRNLNKGLTTFFDDLTKVNPFNYDVAFCEVMQNGGFDCLIGNPPFGAEITADEKALLKIKFPEIDSSTPNTFAYFVGLSKRISTGTIGIVLPDSILIKDFARTRQLLAPNVSHIKWFQNIGVPEELKPFPNVEHDVCVLILKEKKTKSATCAKVNYDSRAKTLVTKEWNALKSEFIFPEFDYAYNLMIGKKDLVVLEKIKKYKVIDDYLQCHEGIHTGNARDILFRDSKINVFCKPLYYGGGAGDEINNYASKKFGWYVDYRSEIVEKKNGYYASLRDERIFKFPKIYITRTGNPFKAFIDKDSYASNNFFSLQFTDYKKNNIEALKLILPFIISKLARYFIRVFAAPRLGDTFVETKIIHLLKFRIPTVTEGQKAKLIELIDEITELSRNYKKNKDTIEVMQLEIDEFIFKLYKISESEQKTVSEHLKS